MSLGQRVRDHGPLYGVLLGLSALFALGAVVTLIPSPLAPWPNLWGYDSVCPFAPGATLGCALLAGITCTLRARLVRRRPGPVFVPAAVLGLLAVLLVWATLAWAGVKAQYEGPDARAGASEASTPQVP